MTYCNTNYTKGKARASLEVTFEEAEERIISQFDSFFLLFPTAVREHSTN